MTTNFLPACELIILVYTLLIINIVGSPMKSIDIYEENRVVIPLNAEHLLPEFQIHCGVYQCALKDLLLYQKGSHNMHS